MYALRDICFPFLALACMVRCEQDWDQNTDDLDVWVRDPNLETTTDKKIMLENMIDQYRQLRKSKRIVDGLKTMRRSGISIDNVIDNIENDTELTNHNMKKIEKKLLKQKLLKLIRKKKWKSRKKFLQNEIMRRKNTDERTVKDVLLQSEPRRSKTRSKTKLNKSKGHKDEEQYDTMESKVDTKDEDLLMPYHIQAQMRELCEDKNAFRGVNCTVSVLGRTVQYNDIVMLKASRSNKLLSFRASDDIYVKNDPGKKIIFIVHGLSTMGINEIPCLYKVKKFRQLLSYYFKHLDKFDILLIPMANPDGVAYSRLVPLWNKNVSPQSSCPGVSLDRNFEVAWNETKKVSSCSQHYPGPMPFSEKETEAIRNIFHRHSNKIIAYLNVHAGSHSSASSYKGDGVLYPKGYTELQTDDDQYIDLRAEIEEGIGNASFSRYNILMDTLHHWYGKIAGSSVDFAASIFDVPYALELVMQPLKDIPGEDSEEGFQNQALVEVWQRVIDNIFDNIYRNSNAPKNRRRTAKKL